MTKFPLVLGLSALFWCTSVPSTTFGHDRATKRVSAPLPAKARAGIMLERLGAHLELADSQREPIRVAFERWQDRLSEIEVRAAREKLAAFEEVVRQIRGTLKEEQVSDFERCAAMVRERLSRRLKASSRVRAPQ